MPEQWYLVAQISLGDGSHSIETVRTVSPDELAGLDEAESFLASLTSASPYESMVAAHREIVDAFAAIDGSEAHGLGATKKTRARLALQHFVGQARQTPQLLDDLARSLIPASQQPNHIVFQALEDLNNNSLWTRVTALVVSEDSEVHEVLRAGSRQWSLDRGPDAEIDIEVELGLAMQALVEPFALLLSAAETAINGASWRIRGLEAEVLLGKPGLARLSPDVAQKKEITIRALPSDKVIAIQTMLRRARAFMESVPRGEGTTKPSKTSRERELSSPPIEQPPRETADVRPTTSEEGPEAPATASQAPLTRPPVDLHLVAMHLFEGLSHVEKSYGELPTIEDVFAAVSGDLGRYNSLLQQIGLAFDEVKQQLEEQGVMLPPVNVPLLLRDVDTLTMNPTYKQGALQETLALLVVLRDVVMELDGLQQPEELRVGPGGVVSYVRFDPNASSRVRGQLLQVARLARHCQERVAGRSSERNSQRSREEFDYLSRAVITSLDHGLYEAALLYASALLESGSPPVSASSVAALLVRPAMLAVESGWNRVDDSLRPAPDEGTSASSGAVGDE